MTDSMLPIIRQLHDADGDRARAKVLLTMSDAAMLKYAQTIAGACTAAKFEGGAEYVLRRVVLMRAERGASGLLPPSIIGDFDEFREALAKFAAGEVDHG